LIETRTLTDGGQTAASIAALLTDFLKSSRESLDIAIYDFKMSDRTAEPVLQAIREAVARGVKVRVVYNVDHDRPIPIPPPPRTDASQIAACGADCKPVEGVPDLMHHKYVVRDGGAVWTGSTNWTEDAWTREENVVVVVQNKDVAAAFAHDFADLWESGRVASSGHFTPQPVVADGSTIRALFCPGRAQRLTHRISGAIARAQRRVRVASPVITSGTILGTLAEVAAAKRVDVAGVYDATQMQEVFGQWRLDGHPTWKIPCFTSLIANAPFGAKISTPYAPGTVHDYMHAKVSVVDDVSFVGSYNLSHSGEQNAENVLEIKDAALADTLASFIDSIRARYPLPRSTA
jgi:phosphatidylserine/phosphatidylglycerophosphate/cardiolipin synthase-like enzyme